MADYAAKREARRKRILENSESRLRRITTLQRDNTEDEIPKHNLNERPIINTYEPRLETNNSVFEENEEFDPLFINSNLRVEHTTNVTKKNTINKKTLIILVIAIATKIFNILCTNSKHIQCINLNQIFIPFLLFKVLDLCVIKTPIKENTFLNTLFFLSNIPAKYIQIITRFINILGAVMQDTFLYFFIFIIMEICFLVSLSV